MSPKIDEATRRSTALSQSGLYESGQKLKLVLSKIHKRAMLEFAKLHLNHSESMKETILCSDETRIELLGRNSNCCK